MAKRRKPFTASCILVLFMLGTACVISGILALGTKGCPSGYVKTKAVVTSAIPAETDTVKNSPASCYLTVEYTTAEGIKLKAPAGETQGYTTGDRLEIGYDSSNPMRISVVTPQRIPSVAVIIAGIIICIISAMCCAKLILDDRRLESRRNRSGQTGSEESHGNQNRHAVLSRA